MIKKLPLPEKNIGNARSLRQIMTDAEKRLWNHVRDRRFAGLKFRRQHPIPPYIADFYCGDFKLIIELDGGYHTLEADSKRTKYLENKGYRVLRFWNNDVLSNTESVLTSLENFLSHQERSETIPAQTSVSHQSQSQERAPSPLTVATKAAAQPPLLIPDYFYNVQYNAACYPGAAGLKGLENGANCQHFSYELLRYFGCVIPDFRSSNLWEDEEHTYAVTDLEELDLVMFSKDENFWGAHIGVYAGQGMVLHLSKKIGMPLFETMQKLMSKPEYKFFGAKRCRIRG